MKRLFFLLAFTTITFSLVGQGKVEYGLATVYSDDFKGRTTASGDKYDPEILTAAHKSLPFGSIVRVTNMENGKKTMVRINDKGPFVKGYVIELSRRAAKDLGAGAGRSKVKLEVHSEGRDVRKSEIEEGRNTAAPNEDENAPDSYEDNNPFASGDEETIAEKRAVEETIVNNNSTTSTQADAEKESMRAKGTTSTTATKATSKPTVATPASSSHSPNKAINTKDYKVFDLYKTSTFVPKKAKGYGVQIGVFHEVHNVLKKTAQLQENWFSNIMLTRENIKGKVTYKVIIGPFDDRASAVAYHKSAAKKGVKGFVVAVQATKGKEIYQIKAVRPEKKGYAVQVMSLTDADHVILEIEKLKQRWFDNILVHVAKGRDGKPRYKILLGPLPDRKRANSYQASLAKNKGIKGFVVDLSKIKASH